MYTRDSCLTNISHVSEHLLPRVGRAFMASSVHFRVPSRHRVLRVLRPCFPFPSSLFYLAFPHRRRLPPLVRCRTKSPWSRLRMETSNRAKNKKKFPREDERKRDERKRSLSVCPRSIVSPSSPVRVYRDRKSSPMPLACALNCSRRDDGRVLSLRTPSRLSMSAAHKQCP